jgi:hypothetical protein
MDVRRSQEAADDPRAVWPATAQLVEHRQRRRRTSESLHVGRCSHPRRAREDVRGSSGKNNEVPLQETDRFGAHGVSPARTPRDQVALDNELSARHHPPGNVGRRRGLHDPRRAQFEVEVHCPTQTNRSQQVREDVRLHARPFMCRMSEHVAWTREQTGLTRRRAARSIGVMGMVVTPNFA